MTVPAYTLENVSIYLRQRLKMYDDIHELRVNLPTYVLDIIWVYLRIRTRYLKCLRIRLTYLRNLGEYLRIRLKP